MVISFVLYSDSFRINCPNFKVLHKDFDGVGDTVLVGVLVLVTVGVLV